MKTTAVKAGMLAMACLATACVGFEPGQDDVTDGLCVYGYRDGTRLELVALGSVDLQIGRLRYTPGVRGPLGYHEPERYACSLRNAPKVLSVETNGVSGVDGFATPDGFKLVTGHASWSDVKVVTDDGELTLDVVVHDVERKWVYFDEQRAQAQDDIVLISGGVTSAVVSYEGLDGIELDGDFVWRGSGDLAWTRDTSVLERGSTSGEEAMGVKRFHMLRGKDALGFYANPSYHTWRDRRYPNDEQPLDWNGDDIDVIDADRIVGLELCWADHCVTDGDTFPVDLFHGYNPPHRLDFHVVFRDDEGREALGVPDDFSITYPEGWEDARHGFAAHGDADWTLRASSEEMAPGVVEVRAYGLTTRVTIDPPTTGQIRGR